MAKSTPEPRTDEDIGKLMQRAHDGPDGCRLWHGPLNQAGYPVDHRSGTSLRVARAVYSAHKGAIRKDWQVEPRCGQPRCINPEHLVQVRKAMACKPLVGVPLAKGATLKSAKYVLVHRPLGVSIWEPSDIAHALQCATSNASCIACGKDMPISGRVYCSDLCRGYSRRKKPPSDGI